MDMVDAFSNSNQAQALVERVRTCLDDIGPIVTERKMFGGTTFLVSGNMLCCVSKSGLMVRVGAKAEPNALAQPFAQPCLGAGRPMAGFIMVAFDGVASDPELNAWLAMARAYVEPMPAKAVTSAGAKVKRPSKART
jgi:TfoX/Sxy family transcriptional regulator of competence genes